MAKRAERYAKFAEKRRENRRAWRLLGRGYTVDKGIGTFHLANKCPEICKAQEVIWIQTKENAKTTTRTTKQLMINSCKQSMKEKQRRIERRQRKKNKPEN
jgi:hypothetical protein